MLKRIERKLLSKKKRAKKKKKTMEMLDDKRQR